MGNKAISIMTHYPTHLLYPGTELTSPCHIRLMQHTRLGSNKYQCWTPISRIDTLWNSNPCLNPGRDNAHSWRLYCAAPLGDQAGWTITWYPTQSHYPDTEPTSPYPLLLMPITWLGSNVYQFWSHCFDSTNHWTSKVQILQSTKTGDGRSTHSAILSRQKLNLVDISELWIFR